MQRSGGREVVEEEWWQRSEWYQRSGGRGVSGCRGMMADEWWQRSGIRDLVVETLCHNGEGAKCKEKPLREMEDRHYPILAKLKYDKTVYT